MDPGRRSDAVSAVHGVVLMVALVVILAAIIAAMLFWLPKLCDPFPGDDLRVLAVYHIDDRGGGLNYDSRVILENTGTTLYENDRLAARFYCDDVPVPCHIETLHGAFFVPTIHNGVERMWGPGCSDLHWEPRERLGIDLRNGSILPGRVLRLDVVGRDDGCIVSRHRFRVGGPRP